MYFCGTSYKNVTEKLLLKKMVRTIKFVMHAPTPILVLNYLLLKIKIRDLFSSLNFVLFLYGYLLGEFLTFVSFHERYSKSKICFKGK